MITKKLAVIVLECYINSQDKHLSIAIENILVVAPHNKLSSLSSINHIDHEQNTLPHLPIGISIVVTTNCIG